MANGIPDATLTAMIAAYIAGKDLRALLIRTSGNETGPYYTYSASHTHLDDVPNNSDCRPMTAVALTSESAASKALDADNVTFSSVPAGDPIQAYYIYDHTGTDSTSELLGYFDTTSDSSLPVTPNGGDITININAAGLLTIAAA